jgi:hypothetical protein
MRADLRVLTLSLVVFVRFLGLIVEPGVQHVIEQAHPGDTLFRRQLLECFWIHHQGRTNEGHRPVTQSPETPQRLARSRTKRLSFFMEHLSRPSPRTWPVDDPPKAVPRLVRKRATPHPPCSLASLVLHIATVKKMGWRGFRRSDLWGNSALCSWPPTIRGWADEYSASTSVLAACRRLSRQPRTVAVPTPIARKNAGVVTSCRLIRPGIGPHILPSERLCGGPTISHCTWCYHRTDDLNATYYL